MCVCVQEILLECYEEVASGREIASVIDHSKRFRLYPIGKIDSTELWQVTHTLTHPRSKSKAPRARFVVCNVCVWCVFVSVGGRQGA